MIRVLLCPTALLKPMFHMKNESLHLLHCLELLPKLKKIKIAESTLNIWEKQSRYIENFVFLLNSAFLVFRCLIYSFVTFQRHTKTRSGDRKCD